LDLSSYKIGYWPNHPGCGVAGDRRRFVFYANERKVSFEVADTNRQYDVVYLTSNCNCSAWTEYKKRNPKTKIIFELIDSYLLENLNFLNILRGPARFVKGKENRLYLDYRKAFIKMISVADAVVCSTPVQKELILRYNKNVHVSLDFFSDDINCHKTDFNSSGRLKLVWEGQAYTVRNLMVMNEAFEALRNDIELHVVTDPVMKYPIKIFDRKTSNLLRGLKCDYTVHDWEKESFSKQIAAADLSVIPIRDDYNLMWNKPENKLLLLWEIGIPVFTSPTPAYKRVMNKAGVDGLCGSTEEWVRKIQEFKVKSAEQKKEMAVLGQNYLKENHSKTGILQKWDAIFASVLHPAEDHVLQE
jgi:hypothetical protein